MANLKLAKHVSIVIEPQSQRAVGVAVDYFIM